MSFFARNLQIFKRIGLPLFVLTLIYTSIDQLLTLNMDAALRNPEGAQGAVWGYGFVSLIVGIIFPIVGMLVVIYGVAALDSNEKGLWQFVRTHMSQLSIEILRSWGKTLLWGLLFILPGFWKYIEYTMLPFVVTLSRRYDQGLEDALDYSARVVKRSLLKVCAILLVFHLFLPMVLTVLFDDYRLLWSTPIPALALTLVDVYLFIFSTQLLLSIFEKNSQEVPDATHV